MPDQVTRRAFLKLTALAAGLAAFARLLPSRAAAAVQACLPMPGMEVPTLVPTEVGDDCAPPPTATLTATVTSSPTATATPTSTASATGTASPTPTSSPTAMRTPAQLWRQWLPLITVRGRAADVRARNLTTGAAVPVHREP